MIFKSPSQSAEESEIPRRDTLHRMLRLFVVLLTTLQLCACRQADPAATVQTNAKGTAGQIRFFPRLNSADRMVGGKFQGSHDGATYTDLYTIRTLPAGGQWTMALLPVDLKTFRYLRYLSMDSTYGNVAEVEFYSGTGAHARKLTGKPFGTPGSFQNSGNAFNNVFDGDTTTYFDGPTPNGNFVGIDQAGASGTVVKAQPVTGTGNGVTNPARPMTAPLTASVASPPVASPPVGSPMASAATKVVKIGFLGDSITYGIGDDGKPGCYDWALTFLAQNGYQVSGVNYGNNGASVTSFYQQTGGPLQAFEKAGVSVVSIMLGTNDANARFHATPQQYHDKLLEIVNSFLAPGTGIRKVILHYSPYIQSSPPAAWDKTADAHLLAYQAQIDSLCNGTTILQGDKMAFRFFQGCPEQGDGVHPNPQGHQDLGRLWAVGITKALGGTNVLAFPTGTH